MTVCKSARLWIENYYCPVNLKVTKYPEGDLKHPLVFIAGTSPVVILISRDAVLDTF